MLVGYVSDESYVALCDVVVELERDGRTAAVVRSSATGAVHADLEPGDYRLVLAKPGYGSKRVEARVGGEPLQLRLLADRLLGYAWPKWVRAPQSAELRVHSPEPYKAELFRYGARKELVRLLGWFDEHGPRAMTQILPDGDFTQTGTGWNGAGWTTGPAFVHRVPAPERSGLYYVHVTGESGAFFSFPWVVAPPRPAAQIAVLAGTNTWNSYNNFGGRSNYVNAEGLPAAPTVNTRQDLSRYTRGPTATQSAPNDVYPPLSFDRPDLACHVPLGVELGDPMSGRLASTLAPGTWRLLGWLERERRDYDLYADHQLHTGELDLDAYRVLVMDMHPEYWSRTMFTRVRDWVFERGGRLVYLGGNGVDCEIEFVGDLAARHLTEQPTAAEPHLENRFHKTAEPSTALLGVTYTPSGEGTAAPYEVRHADHWIFAGTGLRDGDRFGERTLHERVPGGASGHETDKLRPSSPPEAVVLAKGVNPGDGGGEIVCFDVPGGGAVFSAGSITYISALLVDEAVARITTNVLDRFAGSDAARLETARGRATTA